MIEETANNFERSLASDPHFRNVKSAPVPKVGRDRYTYARIVTGEVLINGRWLAFSTRSAEQIWALQRQLRAE